MEPLVADQFLQDPAVIEAQKTLVDALMRHQSKLNKVMPPVAERVQSYEETIKAFSKIRGGNLFYQYLGSGLGNGPFVELCDGSVKYDLINGIGVHLFGHSHPRIIEACIKGALDDTVMQGNLQQGESSYRFSKKLLEAAKANGSPLEHVFLSTTGVMAGENALKMAFQKNHPAHRVLAFDGCFSGRTLAFSQITDKAAFRVGLPEVLQVDHVPYFDPSDPEKSIERSTKALKRLIQKRPKQYGAMFFELVLGEGGYYTATHEFHKALMEICKENGIAVLVDEVQTFGRTSSLFAFQHYKLDKFVDIVWIGKASQVCATLFTPEYCPQPGLISQTFTGSSTAITSGEVVLEMLLNEGYLGENGRINQVHARFEKNFKEINARHPNLLRGPHGIGGMIAFTPFEGNFDKAKLFVQALFKNGVIGFLAGHHEARMRFLPSVLNIEDHHIDEACSIIETTLKQI